MLAIWAAPAVFATEPTPAPAPTVKTIVSGTGTVTWVIPSTSDSGAATLVTPNSHWGLLPDTLWINTAGSSAPYTGAFPTTEYSTTFQLPAAASASISVDVLADNSATLYLNDSLLGSQPASDGTQFKNFDGTEHWTFPTSQLGWFRRGDNTLKIVNTDGDEGVANGIDFKATVTYTPVPLVISFDSPTTRVYDGTTTATISRCSVAPAAAGLSCDIATGATADYANKNVGVTKTVTAEVGDFELTGPLVDEYTQISVNSTTADISKRPVTVMAAADAREANGTNSSAGKPTITAGTLANGDTAVFSQAFAQAGAGYPIALTPAVNSITDGASADMRGNYLVTLAPTDGRIRPGPVAAISFTAQPIDTQVSTPIYSFCAPPASGTLPCATAPTSSPVTVTALDAFSNLAGPGSPGADSSNTVITVTIKETGQTATLGTAPTSSGVASFGNSLVIGATRATTTLAASTSPSLNATSTSFQVVSDLAACDGTTCDSLAKVGGTGFIQKSYGRIKTTDDFYVPGTQNVILTTQFSGFEQGTCANPSKTLGQTSEVRVQGTGVTPTTPEFSVTLIYPKDTIKKAGLTARNADSYDVCLGATWLDTSSGPTAWKAKNLSTGALQNAVAESSGSKVYWGWVPMCSALSSAQYAKNPCIILRTKQAATLKAELVTKQGMSTAEFNAIGATDSDIMIVVRKPWPWDGKFGTGLK
ncbi:MAG: YDG domain-containing protein [Actinomycetes bacterium]